VEKLPTPGEGTKFRRGEGESCKAVGEGGSKKLGRRDLGKSGEKRFVIPKQGKAVADAARRRVREGWGGTHLTEGHTGTAEAGPRFVIKSRTARQRRGQRKRKEGRKS